MVKWYIMEQYKGNKESIVNSFDKYLLIILYCNYYNVILLEKDFYINGFQQILQRICVKVGLIVLNF